MRIRNLVFIVAATLAFLTGPTASAALAAPANPCPRPSAGSEALPPADLYSQNGALDVVLNYYTSLDSADRTLFCFVTPDGLESPTLHVSPGDTLNVTLINQLPVIPGGRAAEMSFAPDISCGSAHMKSTSVNIHFHGTNTRPICHSDEVVHTLVNSGQVFNYHVKFPSDEPPGLYWYHPHVHGIAEAAVLGGATGAIVVDGIENFQPGVTGLPARVLIIRDQAVAGNPQPGGNVPSWDLSLNYVPISYPALVPAVIKVKPGKKEFWRVANTSADTVIDLRLKYDGVAQNLEVVALDGVPTGSQDGNQLGATVTMDDILVPPAGRAEFIMTGPPAGTQKAIFETLAIDTGPDGDNDTRRSMAVFLPLEEGASLGLPIMPEPSAELPPQRFAGLDDAPIAIHRYLYFSEVLSDPSNPASPTNFYITVDGATPALFNPDNPPSIITTRGSVEEWTIANRSQEVHEFHIHQIHFQLRKRNQVAVAPEERQFLDTVQVPYWSGVGRYPSVTVAMDFRGAVVGDFVYHCHILGHEDNGMMALIRVVPPPD